MFRVAIDTTCPEKTNIPGWSDMIEYYPRDGRHYYFPQIDVIADEPNYSGNWDKHRVRLLSE